MPPLARWLGLSGLLPLIGLVLMLALQLWPEWQPAALGLALGYGALILSFLGGLWWGLAAQASSTGRAVPAWVWIAAVLPSLYAVVPLGLVALQVLAARQGLAMVGGGLILALAVDRGMAAAGLAPVWWLALRFPLSLGLGVLCLVAAALG
jgi:hypothetical protein